LAARAGIALTASSPGESRDRQRRQRLKDTLEAAVAFYHDRLLGAPDARPARDYLRSRGINGEVARQFRLGWAPEQFDALARHLTIGDDVLRDSGLGFVNRSGRQQDAFRARVLFPISDDRGDPVAFGGRILPGGEPPKYKNSGETPLYAKSKVLYGLHWAKAAIVAADRVVVCEGYTDVIGFHRAGLPIAVATCGTALTEDHVRTLRRFATRIVLAFDADEAGQHAAERFYAWEKTYDVSVHVARLPRGVDPADLANTNPAGLVAAIDQAVPFLAFRVERTLDAARLDSPEARAKAAERALAAIAEHPNVIVRREYAGKVAARCDLPIADLVRLAERGGGRVPVPVRTRFAGDTSDGAEVVVLALLAHRFAEVEPWLTELCFADPVHQRAYIALVDTGGDVLEAARRADPEAREVLERAAVADAEGDPELELFNLLAAAARRELELVPRTLDTHVEIAEVKQLLDDLRATPGPGPAGRLLTWLAGRSEERV
jgi:DNA primase